MLSVENQACKERSKSIRILFATGNRKSNLHWRKQKANLFSQIKEIPDGKAPGLVDSAATWCQGPWIFPCLCSAAHSISFNLKKVASWSQHCCSDNQGGMPSCSHMAGEREKNMECKSTCHSDCSAWVTAHQGNVMHWFDWTCLETRVWAAPWRTWKEKVLL